MGRLEERIASREVTVERPDADASRFSDGVEGDVGPVVGEGTHGGVEQQVTVAPGVGAHRSTEDLRHRSSSPAHTVRGGELLNEGGSVTGGPRTRGPPDA